MNPTDNNCAIFFPVFKTGHLKILMIFAFTVLAILSFALPSACLGEDGSSYWFRMAVTNIADARNMASVSLYPCALAGTYAAAMALAIIVAGVYSVTKFPPQTFVKLYSATRRRRFLLLLFASLVIAAPVIHSLPVSSAHRSYGFFQNVAQSRLWILIWSAGIWFVGFLAWAAVFVEISRFSRRGK